MVIAHNLKIKRTPFSRTNTFDLPEVPRLPFKPDRRTIERVRARYLRY
jgi:hypothetical protein